MSPPIKAPQIRAVSPHQALLLLAHLYGCAEADLSVSVGQWSLAWTAHDETGAALGAAALRPSPTHGGEMLGGAFAGQKQQAATQALVQAARVAQPQLYAYAEAHLLPAGALEAAGLHRVSAYTRMVGPLPALLPEVPRGFRIVPLSTATEAEDRLAAQRTYSDRIGHTSVPADAGELNFAGTDDTLSRLAYDAPGCPVGICRASREGETVVLGTPGIRADVRETGLRRALLLSVCQAAWEAGAVRVELETWGDTEAERAEDEALGLAVEVFTPIYSTFPPTREAGA